MIGEIYRSNIVEENRKRFFKCAILISDFPMLFLRLHASRIYLHCCDSVNVRLGVMAIRMPADLPVRSVVTN